MFKVSFLGQRDRFELVQAKTMKEAKIIFANRHKINGILYITAKKV